MKGSLTSASAIVQGLKGWMARRRAADPETPATDAVAACGRPVVDGNELDTQQDRWLGPSVDNYS
jgi:hypothetical protein